MGLGFWEMGFRVLGFWGLGRRLGLDPLCRRVCKKDVLQGLLYWV